MEGPKAIETEHNGYRFRSRLEARWAVFFDTLGIRYEYEKEGFDLGKYGRYLPDFWLPDLGVWVEIKPKLWDGDTFFQNEEFWGIDEKQYKKCSGLMRQTRQTVLLSSGNPWPDEYMIQDFRIEDFEGESYGMTEGEWAGCTNCEGFFIAEHENNAYHVGKHTCEGRGRPLRGDDFPPLMAAYKAARQARWEHGAKPVIATPIVPQPKEPTYLEIAAKWRERKLTALSLPDTPMYSMIVSIPADYTDHQLIDGMIALDQLLRTNEGPDTITIRFLAGHEISFASRQRAAGNIFNVTPDEIVVTQDLWARITLEKRVLYSSSLELQIRDMFGDDCLAIIKLKW